MPEQTTIWPNPFLTRSCPRECGPYCGAAVVPRKIVLKVDDLELDRFARTVRRGSCGIELTPKEFALLEFLMQRPRQPVTRLMIFGARMEARKRHNDECRGRLHQLIRRKIDSGF